MRLLVSTCCLAMCCAATSPAQPPSPPPEVKSVEVTDQQIVFRIHAPSAQSIQLSSSDIPGANRNAALEKDEDGIWTASFEAPPGGAYRYFFSIDGVRTLDPGNLSTSQANSEMWSLATVPDAPWSPTLETPRGGISEIHYASASLKRMRRIHVYTPPGYGTADHAYPVLYLLHGATDSDDSWSTVGQAGMIMDHLIASGKAKPMIVVMPHGHTGTFRFGEPGGSFEQQMQEFQEDFASSIRPYIEANYRVQTDRQSRAMAGLSMGGAQTLNITFDSLADYGYIGVFSSGVFGIAGGFGGREPDTTWVSDHKETLEDAKLKQGLELVWFGIGKADFLLSTSDATVEMLENHGFDVTYKQTDGGHTWLNWRDYLMEFAPQLFSDSETK